MQFLKAVPDVEFEKSAYEPVTWRELLEVLKTSQVRSKRQEQSQEFARVKVKTSHPIGIVLGSDWHIGSKGVNYDQWQKDYELVKNEPDAYYVTLSNTIDNFIFTSGIWEQLEDPSSQMDFVKDYAWETRDKLLAVVGSRCHEGWTEDKTDIEVNKLIFQRNIDYGTPFLKDGGELTLSFNEDEYGTPEVEYSLALVHKTRGHSAPNPFNACKQVFENQYQSDIVAVAHHHVKCSLQKKILPGGPYERDVLWFRTGTYKVDDAYGQREGFGHGHLGNPMVVLFPGTKKMIPFYSIEDGINFLKMSRKK